MSGIKEESISQIMEVLEQVDGKWVATVDLGDGSPVQKFYGDTQNDVVTELIKAQTHATRTIREHKRAQKLGTNTPDKAQPITKFEPRSLSVDEKFVLTQQLNDPAQSSNAMRKMIETEFGAPIETVRETLNRTQEAFYRTQCVAESKTFLAANPDFKESAENEAAMVKYLESHEMAYTARNLQIAFDDLKSSDLLQLNVAAQPVAPVGRPRSASTGLPARSNTRVPSAPVGPTAEEINNMDPREYQRRLSDPQFKAHVDKAFGPKSLRT